MKIVTLALVIAACAYADDSDSSSEGARQKRLLFFDEGGSLVRTYSNPYMNKLSENGQNLPFYGNFLNPFFNFIRHFGSSLVAYTIPVSNAIIQAIRVDPNIQNTLVVIPKKDPVVSPNPLCQGKRTQIPSPNMCNTFLNCWDGWAFEQECPTGLMFSINGYCDYADNVDCHNRKIEPDQPELQPVCTKDFEAFRNKLNCNEFFICVNRQPVRFQCPADLVYSQNLGVCDYADRVDCTSSGSSFIPSPNPFYPTPAPSPIAPALPPSPAADTPIIPETPALPILPAIPTSPAIPASPALPSSPEIPNSPIIPPSLPTGPPSSPTIPPAPASIPPLPSLLPPGSVFPSIPPAIYPVQRPVPTPEVFPAPIPGMFPGPIPDALTKPKDKLVFSDFFNPGCSPVNVAMSRQDAIHLLQKSMPTNVPY